MQPNSSVIQIEAAAGVPTHPPRASRWLLFVHQIPAKASNARVRTWRRLQQMGALAVKQAVYVLPDTPSAREAVEWLKTELEEAGGEVTLFAADTVDTWSNDALIAEFRRARQADYAALAREMTPVVRRLEDPKRRSGSRGPDPARLLARLRQRLAALDRVDYFGSGGRDEVVGLLARIERRLASLSAVRTGTPPSPDSRDEYCGRLWVTRHRPGVDRMASAWLIRTFIDNRARFAFADDRDAVPPDAVPYDMYGVRFTHHDGGCTFETLCAAFQLTDATVQRVAAVVHALDLDDAAVFPPEATTIESLIDGLQLAYTDDQALLAEGMVLFDALYRAFAHQARDQPTVRGAATRSRRPSRAARGRRPRPK
jgi:hypothetical protein